jgi:ABC-type multidrug transport system ATPase subunit
MSLAMAAGMPRETEYAPPVAKHQHPQSGRPAIQVRDLAKSFPLRKGLAQILRNPFSFPRAPVLNGIDVDIWDRELFGVLGLNGAGKTTLLKILATLILPESGTASVGGSDILDDPKAVREKLALVTADERSLHWRLSGLENLRLFGALHRLNSSESLDRSRDALASVKLFDVGDKLVGSFSSGMRQRLLIARALLARPRVLLLDEPTRSLDPISAHELRSMLRDEIIAQQGTTVVLATHNAEEAFNYCDRIAVLHQGKVAALGRAQALSVHFAKNIYRVWTPTPDHPCFEFLARRGLVSELVQRSDPEDGRTVECAISGSDEAAEVLRRLIDAHVVVSRFERVAVPLPTLIARIVEAHEQATTAAAQDA